MESSFKKPYYGSRAEHIIRNAEKVNWKRAADRVVEEKRKITNRQPTHDFDVSTVPVCINSLFCWHVTKSW